MERSFGSNAIAHSRSASNEICVGESGVADADTQKLAGVVEALVVVAADCS